MKTRVQKWGNSLAVRVPKSFAESLELETGSPVEMSIEDDAIVIRRDRDGDWNLDTLLSEVTDENIHPSWETEGAWFDKDEIDEGEK
jgi:antitoxin MazE